MIGMYISFFLATQFGIDPIVVARRLDAGAFRDRRPPAARPDPQSSGTRDMPQIFPDFALSLLS